MTISKKSFLFPAALVFYEIATYLSNDMYLPSLPQISRDMQLSQDLAEQTLLFWFLGSASMQLLMGPLSDRYGRKIILMLGGVLYVLASLTCALTPNISLFLLARFIQGSAVCSMVVAGYAAIHELYHTKQAIKIIAMMGSVSILAPAFGPLLGAIILTFFDWQAIFYLLAGWSFVAMLLIGVVMPETNQQKIKIDFKEITRDFINIAKRRAFLCYALPFCLIFLSFICWIVESPFIIIETYHKTPLEYGYIQLAIFGAFIVGTQIVHYCAEKVPTIYLINSGMSFALISALLLVIASCLMPQALYLLVFLLMLFSLGAAIAFAPLNRSAIDACQEPMGRRMAIFSTYMNVFGVIATALITLVNDKTMANLAIVIALGTLASFIYFYLSYRKI
ncbi:Bcr/CflA family efflux MFS transporter [Candidatus Berkiella aquae]|uniref:Bcr/CflA family efflux transporter n=1 Tax=Candidatus Berkiella aquae TaxID=295108 RepID=A0A0Q9YRP3_9GAMM|nr:multidrug effflux MFS transporter [Candidatus Berkiella aquae]MCS5712066.1 multidrug effflux MFS transporter [Candidatus Berkiella aquae]